MLQKYNVNENKDINNVRVLIPEPISNNPQSERELYDEMNKRLYSSTRTPIRTSHSQEHLNKFL